MDLAGLDPAQVEVIFERHGACSVTLTDAGDVPVLEPAPGETPLWGDTRITGLFMADADLDALVGDLLETLSIDTLPAHSIELLEDRAWEREWLKDFGPMQFGATLRAATGLFRACCGSV